MPAAVPVHVLQEQIAADDAREEDDIAAAIALSRLQARFDETARAEAQEAATGVSGTAEAASSEPASSSTSAAYPQPTTGAAVATEVTQPCTPYSVASYAYAFHVF